MNFIEKCCSGQATALNIDEEIEAWHNSDSELPLHEFLGLKEFEYALWLKEPNSLDFIISLYIKTGRRN